ncbi:hypothetical protein RYX36_007332, partial [Vicia faba]
MRHSPVNLYLDATLDHLHVTQVEETFKQKRFCLFGFMRLRLDRVLSLSFEANKRELILLLQFLQESSIHALSNVRSMFFQ